MSKNYKCVTIEWIYIRTNIGIMLPKSKGLFVYIRLDDTKRK